jgi:hypothetical protein
MVEATQEVSKEVEVHEEITAKGMVITADYAGTMAKAGIRIEVDVITLLKALAAKTDNKIDDALVAMVAGALA